MPEERFDIVFRGRLLDGQDPAAVREQVGRMFKVSGAQLERLFSGRPMVIKRAVDTETAGRYRLAFRQAGALVEVRISDLSEDGDPAPRWTPASTWTLLPSNSGTLEGYAPRPAPSPLPDIRHLALATPGTGPAEQAPPPAATPIGTGTLDLVAGQDWTLEDCQPPPLPEVLPDMDDLALSAPGAELDSTPPPAAAPIDTGTLDLVAERDWTLDDCQLPPLPEVLPDISGLTLEEPEPKPEPEAAGSDAAVDR